MDIGQKRFLSSLAALLAKMAKADGIVTSDERDKVSSIWDKLGLTIEQSKYCSQAFNIAQNDGVSLHRYVQEFVATQFDRRNSHKGTLWESAYFDRIVTRSVKDMAECLAYIHLNPIRAAASDRFDGYVWSSYSAFRKGEPIATAGMRFVYGEAVPDGEIADRHEYLLETLLEKERLRRAEEIARKRAVGYEIPPDPLTTEAMVAQKAAHIAEVQKSLVELHETGRAERRCTAKRELHEKEVVALLRANPGMDVPLLAERLGVGISMAYHVVGGMRKRGILEKDRRRGVWNIVKEV